MPEFWNNLLVVKESELVPTFYKSLNSLEAQVSKHKKLGYGIKSVQRGGGPNTHLLIDFDSLYPHMKEYLGDPRKGRHILERYYRTDKETINFYTEYKFNDGSYIDDYLQQRYITNASMIKALLALKEDRIREIITKSGKVKNIYGALLSDAMSFNPVLKKKYNYEHTLPESEKRFREALEKFAKNSYITVISGKQKNVNAKKMNDKIIQLLNNMFSGQTHKPTYAEVSGQYEGYLNGYVTIINDETAEEYNPKEYKPISESTIQAYLSQWENKIGNEAKRSGDRQKLMSKFSPYFKLEMPKYSGSIVSIDDRQPPFEYEKGKRMWFYNAIDLGSEAFTCWVYGKTKEGIILEFYRQLVRNHNEWGLNLPAELECESSLNSSFKDTFLRDGYMFENVRIEANSARSKRIEAFFKPLRYGLEKKREGWLARPFALSESNQSGNKPQPIIPYNDIIIGCLKDIETWNNMPHSVHTNKTRWEVFIENQHPNIKPTNYKAILPYLGYKTQTSCHVGQIKLQGNDYILGDNGSIYTGEKLIQLMTNVEGENVDIYWIDDNEGKVFKALVYMGNQYICEALSKPETTRAKIERTEESEKNRELMSRYKATVDGFMSSQKCKLDNVTIIDSRPLTLNNKFSIFGNKPLKQVQGDVESEVEILPESQEEEFDLIPVESTYKSSLKERF